MKRIEVVSKLTVLTAPLSHPCERLPTAPWTGERVESIREAGYRGGGMAVLHMHRLPHARYLRYQHPRRLDLD